MKNDESVLTRHEQALQLEKERGMAIQEPSIYLEHLEERDLKKSQKKKKKKKKKCTVFLKLFLVAGLNI